MIVVGDLDVLDIDARLRPATHAALKVISSAQSLHSALLVRRPVREVKQNKRQWEKSGQRETPPSPLREWEELLLQLQIRSPVVHEVRHELRDHWDIPPPPIGTWWDHSYHELALAFASCLLATAAHEECASDFGEGFSSATLARIVSFESADDECVAVKCTSNEFRLSVAGWWPAYDKMAMFDWVDYFTNTKPTFAPRGVFFKFNERIIDEALRATRRLPAAKKTKKRRGRPPIDSAKYTAMLDEYEGGLGHEWANAVEFHRKRYREKLDVRSVRRYIQMGRLASENGGQKIEGR